VGRSERHPLPVVTTRRVFVCDAARALAAGAVAGVTGPLLTACARDTADATHGTLPAATRQTTNVDVSSITADGESIVTPSNGPDGAPILIVRRSAEEYLALSMQCTHEGCPINPPVRGVMMCPCHGSQFDLSGQVRRGPAQYPLGRYVAVYHPANKTLTVMLD
jgi:thiosulfate dehydrogenase [quinone] large subunit